MPKACIVLPRQAEIAGDTIKIIGAAHDYGSKSGRLAESVLDGVVRAHRNCLRRRLHRLARRPRPWLHLIHVDEALHPPIISAFYAMISESISRSRRPMA